MEKIILYTGKGGVGKTSIAAATASLLAGKGKRTLIISTDPAHSLSDAFETQIGNSPTEIGDNLWGQEISVIEAINSHWKELKMYLTGLFQSQGLDPSTAEEIATLPGFEEASHLLYLEDHIKSGKYDVIVMDSAPTGESLKLLSFPEAMSWYMEKIFPIGRTTAKVIRPLVRPFTSIPFPNDEVLGNMESLYNSLKRIRDYLADPDLTSIRLVTNPNRMSFNETKRAYTYLLLYGYNVDALIINKVYPPESGEFFKLWIKVQDEILKETNDAFPDLKLFSLKISKSETLGRVDLEKMGKDLYRDEDPLAVFTKAKPVTYEKSNGKYTVKMKLPFASKEKINLFNSKGELVVEVENWRRIFYLPTTFSDKNPVSAEFINGELNIEMV
ncbi:MAG: ArsA family ATPase [Thermoplasmataceae archaeon]|jgi:arsenite-transporting ATPase